MPITVRIAEPDDFDAIIERDEQAFGYSMGDDERTRWRDVLPFGRLRLAHDDGQLVGVAGTFELELTLPGGMPVAMGGTTMVSVAPTHRRQGLLRRLLDEVHADVDARGEPVMALGASEGGIYERFGYGVATRCRVIEIDRRRTTLADRFVPEPGSVRLVDPRANAEVFAAIFDRYRRGRVGEVSRTAPWMAMRIAGLGKNPQAAVHADGFAIWTIEENWAEGDAQHELRVHDLVAATPDAHAALWHLMLSVDLIGPIRSRYSVSVDDPLPLLVTDPRAMRTVALNDFLWVCPCRAGELLANRRYRVADELVVEVVDGDETSERWNVAGGPDGASATATSAAPDVTMTRAAMGALLLGGVSVSELAAGGRLTVASPNTTPTRLDAFFGWTPSAHSSTPF